MSEWRSCTENRLSIFDACCESLQHIYWFKAHHSRGKVDSGWRRLGPHCALVQENGVKKVYRSYDSRPWAISRSSAVYEHAELDFSAEVLLHDVDKPEKSSAVYEHAELDLSAEVLLHDVDKPEKKVDDGDHNGKCDLFQFCGAVKVLSVRTHIASSASQLVQIAEYLQLLHGKNVVHGDIRLLSMVFRELGSVLIDFDFADSTEDPRTIYPPHYRNALIDGRRPGEAGVRITEEHDVLSLIQVCLLVTSISREDVLVEPSLQKLIAVLKAYKGPVKIYEKALAKCLLRHSNCQQYGDPGSQP